MKLKYIWEIPLGIAIMLMLIVMFPTLSIIGAQIKNELKTKNRK